MPPSPRRGYHMSDPPSTAESRMVTFPAVKPIKGEDRYPLTETDIAALAPRSPDRLKAQLQAQESPGWSFVMKNEDFGYEYPKKSRTSQESHSMEAPPAPPLFKRPSNSESDKPRRHLLSFGKKKSKAPLSGSPVQGMISSPRPIMPSPKRFGKSASAQTKADTSVDFTTSPSRVNGKPPPTPPEAQHSTQPPTTAADCPLPPSPTRSSSYDDPQASPLEPYFLPSPAPLRSGSPSKRSFDFPHLSISRNASALSHNTETLPTRQGLRDVMLASIDLLLEDHYTSLESMHQNQIRRITHLERSAQEASLALVQSQKDYTALEATLLTERENLASTSNELKHEKETRQAQAKESTALIAQLENQLAGSKRTISTLENRVTKISASLTESQNEIDRLEKDMTKGYDEIRGRLSGVERLEKDAGEWRRKAEEAEFTVRALREEGVRMSRELDRKSKVIEELEKGRRFVTRV